jgi:sterol desaturase/sphingolipid hydroxylase (fatty acid hydroxylase superfamily)
MFDNVFIDTFSRNPPFMVPVIYLPIVAWAAWTSVAERGQSALATAGLWAVGLMAWTLTEYWLHRKLFHWQPGGRIGERFHFIAHGVHHLWPRDRYRLVMPAAVSGAIAVGFWFAFSVALGPLAPGFFAGFVSGYVAYEMLHYTVHHHAPKLPMLKKLRRHHLVHHFKEAQHERKFGVSTTLWDHVFRTY